MSSDVSSGSDSYSELRSIHRLNPKDGTVLSRTVFPSEYGGSGNDGFMGADLVSSDESGLTVWATGYVGGEGKPEDEDAMFLIEGGKAFAMKIEFSSEGEGRVLWERVFDGSEDGFTMEQGMRVVETDNDGGAILISTAIPDEGLLQWR